MHTIRLIRVMFFAISVGVCCIHTQASNSQWSTHFAYNSVRQIAVTPTETYALANGAIFSVNKQSEQLTKYDNRFGLHGSNLACIAYDSVRAQLLLLYSDGKMDIMSDSRIRYVSDLYQKRMTASKSCNNVTIVGDKAYLSMDFGILLFDLVQYEFVETYYIGQEAEEVRVTDVLLVGDSIYAQTESHVYSAALTSKLVDYRYWHICSHIPIPFDEKKGKYYVDEHGDCWQAGGTQGITRRTRTGEQSNYLPEGPTVNIPYRMTTSQGRLFVVPGGRWASQNKTPGCVMILDDGHWTHISTEDIVGKTNKPALDFMNVAVDVNDAAHFFVTSYGTGVYEFKEDRLWKHYTAENSLLSSAVVKNPDAYTRTDGAIFDNEGRVWVENASNVDSTLVVFMPDGSQRGVNLYNGGKRFLIYTPAEICIDSRNSHRKWMLSCRSTTAILLLDDGGTTFDGSDDVLKIRTELFDQNGRAVSPDNCYTITQAPNGDVWVGSSIGPIILEQNNDFLLSDRCKRLAIRMTNGEFLLETERTNAIAFDKENRVWLGTQTAGVYVLNEELTKIEAHYTSDNTPMPTNTVLSLAYDSKRNIMYIGTGEGLVSYQLYTDKTSTSQWYLDTSEDNWTYGSMLQWRAHPAYSSINQVVAMPNKVYALSNGALFSVDKQSEELEYYSRLSGLNGSVIDNIAYNAALHCMLITYQDGQLDLMDSGGSIVNIPDLYLRQSNSSMQVNDIVMSGEKAYLAMNFGIIVLNLKKHEIEDTYYVGEEAKEVPIQYITVDADSIYAISKNILYTASLKANLADFSFWNSRLLPNGKTADGLALYGDTLYIVSDGILWTWQESWVKHSSEYVLRGLRLSGNSLYALLSGHDGIARVQEGCHVVMDIFYGTINDIVEDGSTIWFATRLQGLVRRQSDFQEFHPDGPVNNMSYRLRFFGDRLYVMPGSRWATEAHREGTIMYYENGIWTNITYAQLLAMTGNDIRDVMNVAQDPQDANHYFVTTYGTGMLEMNGQEAIKLYQPSNSPLQSAAPAVPAYYTRTDGAMYDDLGNLWVLNAGNVPNVHVIQQNGEWSSFNIYADGNRVVLYTPGEILVDKRNTHWKWIPECRSNTGLILIDDNGTPANPSDDNVTYRQMWYDQQGKIVMPEYIYTLAQDQENTLWVGTSTGVFLIPSSIDFTTSNRCERIILSRNDGTGLGDYLLGNEQINCIVVDSANRKWIGTATSGVYLMSPDGQETIEHFTVSNSIMLSDNVLSIAIHPYTGEVFIGTGTGLVSYMSNAIKPEGTYANLYAYPNPVHPNYKGYITIRGLVDNSEVRITDSSGNLVKTIQGLGGEAVWDGTNTTGKRVASGVYTAICNTKDGTAHGYTKILIIN